MSELTSMTNIGKEMARKLTAIGVNSPEELSKLGTKQSFKKLKEAYLQVWLVHLYAMEGAIRNIDFNDLSNDTKKDLKEFSDFLKH